VRLTANKIAGILREKGYRLTPQRHAVLKVVAESHEHLSPAEICSRVHKEHPNIGLATVYRVLNLLSELKLICRISVGGSHQGYLMRRPLEHHHHLICSHCEKAVDFSNCDLSPLERQLSQETKFRIEGHILEIYGTCPDCFAAVTK
jgi:Fe2+ or Zn2+ uptake regulation protein